MDFNEKQIAKLAFSTRVFLIWFQFLANALIPDHNAGVFSPPRDQNNLQLADKFVHFFLGGFRRWDAVYFTHIMEFGYTYENSAAFFPMYPVLVLTVSKPLRTIGILHSSSWVLLTAVSLNVLLFTLTAVLLYRLGKFIVHTDVSFYGAQTFCINPASIFMTAPYSEITYMFFLILALLHLHKNALYRASLIMGLSIFTRSNGIIGVGFILHYIAKMFVSNLIAARDITNLNSRIRSIIFNLILVVINSLLCIALSLIPFFLYQFYIYHTFCFHTNASYVPAHLIDYGRSQGYHILGDSPSSWCYDFIPWSYFYIQKQHWDVGFLSYYQWKQLPNFLLAAPIFVLSARTCYRFFISGRQEFFSLGLVTVRGSKTRQGKRDNSGYSQQTDDHKQTLTLCEKNYLRCHDPCETELVAHEDIVVYVCHLVGLTVFGCFFIHIQVLTRMLCSSCPVLYWYCGSMFLHKQQSKTSLKGSISADTRKERTKSQSSTEVSILGSLLAVLHLDFVHHVVTRWRSLSTEYHVIFIYCITYCLIRLNSAAYRFEEIQNRHNSTGYVLRLPPQKPQKSLTTNRSS